MFRWILTGLVGCVLSLGVSATEFRIESNVQGVRSTAFLLVDTFYSMVGDNGEIVQFDADKKTFTLIDPALRIQTQIDAEETRRRVEQLRQQVLNDPEIRTNSFRHFVFNPIFESEFDAASGMLALQSPWIDYEIKTIPFTDVSSSMYYDFCDWVCYLNFRLHPRSSQMLVRLGVNRLLREKQRFAVSVSSSLYPGGKQGFARPDRTSSSHDISRRLSDADRRRIEQAEEFKRTFPQVPFDEYQRRHIEKLAR